MTTELPEDYRSLERGARPNSGERVSVLLENGSEATGVWFDHEEWFDQEDEVWVSSTGHFCLWDSGGDPIEPIFDRGMHNPGFPIAWKTLNPDP